MYAWHDAPWMWLSMGVFWTLLAAFAYYAISRHPTVSKTGPQAAEILEQRYARGEISTEQYHERRDTLRASHTPPDEQ